LLARWNKWKQMTTENRKAVGEAEEAVPSGSGTIPMKGAGISGRKFRTAFVLILVVAVSAQHVDQVHELIGFLEPRKEKIFLKFLVIIFHEIANDSRGLSQSFGWKILLPVESAQYFAVN